MKADKSKKPATDAVAQPGAEAEKPDAKASDLGLTERRQAVRPLPVPEAFESDRDTDWATFHSLINEPPKS